MIFYELVLIVLLLATGAISQYQYQQFSNVVPYTPQYAAPYYEQIPYYSQLVQQPVYYPVNQQQLLLSPSNGQGMYYPYPYQYAGLNQQQPIQEEQLTQQLLADAPTLSQNQAYIKVQPLNITSDPFINVTTEIIDVKPEEFRRIMQKLHLQPTIVSYQTRVIKHKSGAPHYTVTAQSSQSNKTFAPKSMENFKSSSKVYTFNKTFVLHPGEEKNSVINLTFVNGEQVTPKSEDETTTSNGTTYPQKGPKRFIDVPTGCKEGDEYSATGGCFAPFRLPVNPTGNNTK